MAGILPTTTELSIGSDLCVGVSGSDCSTYLMGGIVNWSKDVMSYDVKHNQFIKDVEFDGYKFRIVYTRLLDYEDEYVIKKVLTLDGQDILDLLRDKFIERLERIVK